MCAFIIARDKSTSSLKVSLEQVLKVICIFLASKQINVYHYYTSFYTTTTTTKKSSINVSISSWEIFLYCLVYFIQIKFWIPFYFTDHKMTM